MKLTDLIGTVLVESGQFLLGDNLAAVQLDETKFWTMTQRVLEDYERYRPLEKVSQLEIFTRSYTFQSGVGIGVPEWISEMVPTSTPNNPLGSIFSASTGTDPLVPREFLWEYRNPVVYVTEGGTFELSTVHKYGYAVTMAGLSVTDVDFTELTLADTDFVDLVVAKFIQSLGKSRRAFTLSEIPIVTDAADMVSEGKEMYDAVMERIRENSKWYLGVGQ